LVKDFYAYEDKYINNEATVKIPADITLSQHQQIKKLAETVYRKCECRGFARIDFFIANGEVYINEVNTLPGFTDISMFPMLIKHSGISYTQLIDIIISLAY
jgi:D-alanine-D-alanine ligase